VKFLAEECDEEPETLLVDILPVGEDLDYDASLPDHKPFAVLIFLDANFSMARPGEGFPHQPSSARGRMESPITPRECVIAEFISDSLLLEWDAWSPLSISVLAGRVVHTPNGLIRMWDPTSTATTWKHCSISVTGQTGAWATPLFHPATSMMLRFATGHLVVRVYYKGKWHTICLLIFLLAVYASLFCVHRQRSGATAWAFTRHTEFNHVKAAAGAKPVADKTNMHGGLTSGGKWNEQRLAESDEKFRCRGPSCKATCEFVAGRTQGGKFVKHTLPPDANGVRRLCGVCDIPLNG